MIRLIIGCKSSFHKNTCLWSYLRSVQSLDSQYMQVMQVKPAWRPLWLTHPILRNIILYQRQPFAFLISFFPFFSTYIGFLSHVWTSLPSPMWQNAKVLDSTRKENIADVEYNFFERNIDFLHSPSDCIKKKKRKNYIKTKIQSVCEKSYPL